MSLYLCDNHCVTWWVTFHKHIHNFTKCLPWWSMAWLNLWAISRLYMEAGRQQQTSSQKENLQTPAADLHFLRASNQKYVYKLFKQGVVYIFFTFTKIGRQVLQYAPLLKLWIKIFFSKAYQKSERSNELRNDETLKWNGNMALDLKVR